MKFLHPAIKLIVGCFLFGVVFLATPKSAFAYSPYSNFVEESANFTLGSNVVSVPLSNFNVNIDGLINQYGLIPYSSFDVALNFEQMLRLTDFHIYSRIDVDVYLLFTAPDGGAYSTFISNISLGHDFYNENVYNSNYYFSTSCDGVPTGVRVVFNRSHLAKAVINYDGTLGNTSFDMSSSDGSYNGALYFSCYASISNFSTDSSSGGVNSSSTIINNTTGSITPIGYSSLNFGLNGNCYFLGGSRIFQPDYLTPLAFYYDFANNLSGVINSAPLTFAMGDFASLSPLQGSPIAVIGDTRAGEYEITISLCLDSSPSVSQLSNLIDLNNWGFEFNRGYSGDQFAMPSNCRISYTNFIDGSNNNNYCYTSIYFYFTTPDYFDSFLIRKAPTLNNIRVGAFAFNKYTGTISDQLNQNQAHWEAQQSNHQSFTSANTSAASTVSAMQSIEADTFSNLDNAMVGAGVSNFNLSVISTPMTTLSGMINQTYNILPDLVKWLILAILVIGIFAVIISSNNYVNKD